MSFFDKLTLAHKSLQKLCLQAQNFDTNEIYLAFLDTEFR